MLGEQVLLLPVGLAGATGQGQEWDLAGRDASVITVSNGRPWGDWAWPEMCPKDSYASGIGFKVEPPQGVTGDDTVLNRIGLHCSHGRDPGVSFTAEYQSDSWGHQSEAHWCLSDEVAVTSARFACSGGHIPEGPGSTWGQQGGWSPNCPRVVCGIQTQQDPAQGLKRDNTALNDLCLFWCP
ncbi:LOW QUALITY PROTEIN: vitelline membrane outer layer protein 1 homolog [Strix aluco]|uniref:LOW QUALITY PROTEIN: vitelline membrane outer layer protein 1 homolog n=1 Tax=Strix aluco TaxID=111821 RepID=UPI003DA42502